MRLQEWEDEKCPCGCGQPMTLAHDKTKTWVVDDFTCYAGRALDQVKRLKAKEHEDAPDGWDDGKHWYVRDPTQEELDKQPRVTGRAGGGDGV